MERGWSTLVFRLAPLVFGTLAIIFLLATLWSGYRSVQTGGLGAAENLAPFASATATLFLVVVTAFYARSTRQNVDLATRELNQEIREKHTETLRKRVDRWLGEEYDMRHDSRHLGERNVNFPYVRQTEIEPAPAIMSFIGLEEDFRAAPEVLEDDPFFKDLIENHVPELRSLMQEIERLDAKLNELQEEFEQVYEETQAIEELPFPARPAIYFKEWAFERVILLERGIRDKEGLDDIAETAVDRETHADNEKIWFPGDNTDVKAVIECSQDVDPDKEKIVEAIQKTIDRLDENETAYEIGTQAAEVLDEADEQCRELEMKLVEYRGRLVYPGDCDYIKEASI